MHWQASDLVDHLALQERAGLLFVDEYGHRRNYTFAEVAKYSLAYAAVLRAFGVRQDERVYLSLSTTAKCVFTLLALDRIGAQAVLDDEDAAGVGTVIANRKYRERIDTARARFSRDARYLLIGEECEGWARLDTLVQVTSAAAQQPRSDEPADLLQARAREQRRLSAFSTDTVWCTMHIEDSGWFENAIVGPWLCGAAVVVHDGAFNARERLDLVRDLDVTVLLQPLHEYRAELRVAEPRRFTMPRLRRCIVLGNEIDEMMQAPWIERFGVALTPQAAPSQQKA
jgi:acetyl-CoA synthetase